MRKCRNSPDFLLPDPRPPTTEEELEYRRSRTLLEWNQNSKLNSRTLNVGIPCRTM